MNGWTDWPRAGWVSGFQPSNSGQTHCWTSWWQQSSGHWKMVLVNPLSSLFSTMGLELEGLKFILVQVTSLLNALRTNGVVKVRFLLNLSSFLCGQTKKPATSASEGLHFSNKHSKEESCYTHQRHEFEIKTHTHGTENQMSVYYLSKDSVWFWSYTNLYIFSVEMFKS